MICRKIQYFGHFDEQALMQIFDITRKNEITGEVRSISPTQIELNLEGDASFIKLIQHQVENALKSKINNKQVSSLPYQNYRGINLLP